MFVSGRDEPQPDNERCQNFATATVITPRNAERPRLKRKEMAIAYTWTMAGERDSLPTAQKS